MSNREKNSEDLNSVRLFDLNSVSGFVLTSSFKPKKIDPEEWSYLEWSKWREIRLKELLEEEQQYWEEENRKELKEWEWIELGKEDHDEHGYGKPFENEVERYVNIREHLHGIERNGSKIHPGSLTQNRYGEGYIILAESTAESRKEAYWKNLALNKHLNEKKPEFEKELTRAQDLFKNEKFKKEEEERINRLKKQEEERIKWENMTDEEKEKSKEDESRRKEATKLLFKKK
ncbi:MAG: hypothetical protein Q8N97_05240 [Methanobacteriaceae archaeon]|nr:hypothetical protein [Methanobacteriaceae archaeon]